MSWCDFKGSSYNTDNTLAPYSFGPDGFVEPGVDAHIWSSHLLHGKFPDLFKCPRGTLLEAHSMDALVDVDGILWLLPR